MSSTGISTSTSSYGRFPDHVSLHSQSTFPNHLTLASWNMCSWAAACKCIRVNHPNIAFKVRRRSSKHVPHLMISSTHSMCFSSFSSCCIVAWKNAVALGAPYGTRVGVNSPFIVAIVKIDGASSPNRHCQYPCNISNVANACAPHNRSISASRSRNTAVAFCICLFTKQ